MSVNVEKVRFYSEGVALAGLMYDERRPGRRPGIVICHGFGGLKEGTPPSIAGHLAGLGYVCLTFDYRGFGESEGPPGRLIPEEQAADVRSAMTYLETRPEVDPTRIGLYGTSFGGGNVSYVTARDRRVRCTVATVSVTDGEAWLRDIHPYWHLVELLRRCEDDRRRRVLTGAGERIERFEIMYPDPKTRAFYEAVFAQHPEQNVPLALETVEKVMTYKPIEHAHLITTPILWICAENDILVDPDQTRRIYERCASPQKALVSLPGAGHFDVYAGETFDAVMRHTGGWFQEHLAVAGRGEPGAAGERRTGDGLAT